MRKQTTQAGRTRRRPTRAYTRGFTPRDGTGREFKIREIPAGFWIQVRAKAKREGVSIRGLFLTRLQEFLEQEVSK
jgi:hypothetical protein